MRDATTHDSAIIRDDEHNQRQPATWEDRTVRPGYARRMSNIVVIAASIVGVIGFLWPFLVPLVAPDATSGEPVAVAPILLAVVTGLALLAIMMELGESGTRPAKTVALLGVLVAANAALRLLPSFIGASPVFLMIMLTGATFGRAIGFQMGALTLLLSGFLTGGVGPFLPYQMLGAGWVGLTAGLLPRLPNRPRLRLLMLAGFGAVWGIAFGVLLNLSFWPFTAPGVQNDNGFAWVPGMSFLETIETYARFYLVTSLAHDLTRAVGNVILILVLGGPILRLLDRYRARFAWTSQ